METLEILNIPNYYSSYYLYGFSKKFKLKYRFDSRFERFNNRPFLVFSLKGKLGVIENNDPHGPKEDLYAYVDRYFATNKLIGHPEYSKPKIKPLFPHFPINAFGLYVSTFGFNLFSKGSASKAIQDLRVLLKRPHYSETLPEYHFHNKVFFSANLWKKEPETNQIRASFMQVCQEDDRIEFEGGFVKRGDGDAMGFDDFINEQVYPPKVFSKLSSETLLSLNNPAVLGAVSWRLAEYFAKGIFVLSFPSAIDLPKHPDHGEHIHYVDDVSEFQNVIDQIFENPAYHEKISRGARKYFEKYCTPEAQVEYILQEMELFES